MIIKCESCGAPLDVPDNAQFAQCQYCKATSKVRSTQAMQAAFPPSQPPPVFPTFPPQTPQAGPWPPIAPPIMPAYVPPRRSGGGAGVVVAIAGVLIAVGVAVAVRSNGLFSFSVNPNAAPTIGTVALGTQPSVAQTFYGHTNGRLEATRLNGTCRGYVESAPHMVLNVTAPQQVSLTTTMTTLDLTMVLRTPQGGYICDDDSGEGTNPRIETTLIPGVYQVWVGVYHRNESSAFSLVLRSDNVGSVPTVQGLAPESAPSLGVIAVDGAPEGTPLVRTGIAGGRINATSLGYNCRGYVSPVPHVALQVATAQDLAITATAPQDTTMVVRSPDGTLRCDDDSAGSLNPMVRGTFTPGTYEVWVGTYSEGGAPAFTLTVQRNGSLVPTAPTPAPTPVPYYPPPRPRRY